jgi:polysaccharide chain length determinant protein (PEP-CTERM system associated)
MVHLLYQARSVLPGLWAQRWHGLAAAAAVGVLAVGAIALIPDKYEASARMFVDTQSILKPLMTGMTVQPNVEQQMSMMGRTLISRPNVERAAHEAGMDREPIGADAREKLIETLMRDIQFRTAGRENLYAISYRGKDPAETLKLIESLLAIFAQTKDSAKVRDNEQARAFIDSQIEIYERRLQDAENALKDFKVRNITVMPNLAQDYVARSNDAQRELGTARLELRQAENSREALVKRLADEPATFVSADTAAAGQARAPTEIDLRIESTRKRLDDLLTRFTEEHPDVVGTRRVLDQQLAERAAAEKAKPAGANAPGTVVVPNKLYQDIKLQLATTEATIASLRAKVAEAERRLQAARDASLTIPKVEAEFAQLNRDYDVNKKNYEALLARRESAQLSGSLATSPGVGEFRTVDPPRVSPRPVWPNRPLLFLAALVLSLSAGVAFAWLRERMRPTFRDAWSLQQETGLVPIGVVSLALGRGARQAERRDATLFGTFAALYLLLIVGAAAFSSLRHLIP